MVNFYDKYIVCGNDSSTATLSDVAGTVFLDQQSYPFIHRFLVEKKCYIIENVQSTFSEYSLTFILFTDHIDYIKNQIGVDYVGIGADYDGVPT